VREASSGSHGSLTRGVYPAAGPTFLEEEHHEDAQPFGVEDGALSALASLKPGDHVKVMYVEAGDKRIIKSIVKA